MAAGQSLVLLLVLTVLGTRAAPSAEDCSKLTKALTKADLQKVSGDWAVVWSLTTPENDTDIGTWRNLLSSYVELRLNSDIMTYTERSLFPENTCMNFYANMSIASENQQEFGLTSHRKEMNGVITQINANTTMKFYENCADCLPVEYSDIVGRILLIYKRDGLHQKAEELKAGQDHGQKLAECLGFPFDEKPFIYDGVADFCHRQAAKPDQA